MEINELRRKLGEFVADDETTQLEDEAWYDQLWELLDPALQTRANAKRARAQAKRDARRCSATDGENRCAFARGHVGDHAINGRLISEFALVEFHRFTFEGSTSQLADHLRETHHLTSNLIDEADGGLTQGHWSSLDNIHRRAHEREYRAGQHYA